MNFKAIAVWTLKVFAFESGFPFAESVRIMVYGRILESGAAFRESGAALRQKATMNVDVKGIACQFGAELRSATKAMR
jgi:hypothetical protein